MISLSLAAGFAQQTSAPASGPVTIQGMVRDSANHPVADAAVRLEKKGSSGPVETKTNAAGLFVFPSVGAGSYTVSAEKTGLHSGIAAVPISSGGDPKTVELFLKDSGSEPTGTPRASASSIHAMEFADQPNFTVAGVTDWTAVGGHGSDSSLRTSEALTRDTLTLKPDGESAAASRIGRGEKESESKLRAALAAAPASFEANRQLGELYLRGGRYRESVPLLFAAYNANPRDAGNEYDLAQAYERAGDLSQAREHVQHLLAQQDKSDFHRLSGDIDEKLGDPLAAVREYEQAVHLESSESNYFAWGSELLLHRAVWQAQEVFAKGAAAYPKSARMLAALGTALFAGARYEDAALRLCKASDLNPLDPDPYIFMGKIQMVAPAPLACIERKLARFAQEQPGSSLANYLYAMALLKDGEQSADQRDSLQAETLLTRAVNLDPKCAEAYVQLGVLDFSRRDYVKAIGFYRKAIEANPQLSEAHYRLGVAYDRTGDHNKAQQEFQLHDEIEKQQAAAIEQQRREVKQFLVVLQGQPQHPPAE